MIDAAVLGRVGIDLYPNELETPLAEYGRSPASSAGSPGTSRPGSRASACAPRSSRASAPTARRLRPRLPRARGRRRALPRHRPVLADAADVLRGVAARPVPDHLLPQADRPRLAALRRRTSTRKRSRPRRCSTRRAPASRSRRAGRRRSRRCGRTAGRRSSTSTGGRRSGTTRPSIRARRGRRLQLPTSSSATRRRSGRRARPGRALVLKRGERGPRSSTAAGETDVPRLPRRRRERARRGRRLRSGARPRRYLRGLPLVEAVRRGTRRGRARRRAARVLRGDAAARRARSRSNASSGPGSSRNSAPPCSGVLERQRNSGERS